MISPDAATANLWLDGMTFCANRGSATITPFLICAIMRVIHGVATFCFAKISDYSTQLPRHYVECGG